MKRITPKRIIIAVGIVLVLIGMRMGNANAMPDRWHRYYNYPDPPWSTEALTIFWIGVALSLLPVVIPWLRKQLRG
jgi:small neutral amino acid transporter SnatA (MarC family)